MNPVQQHLLTERLWDPDRNKNGPYRSVSGPVTGVVVSADDPLNNGRVRVYCSALNDDPRNPESVPWAVYCSPFFGTIDTDAALRGPNGDTVEGAVAYGMWAIPEVGSEVVIQVVNNDPTQRIWIGSIPKHQQVNSWGHGRYVWSDDAYADGPYSGGTVGQVDAADTTPYQIQPTYDNLDTAFNSKKTSPEWLSRGADLQGMVNETKTTYTGSRDQRFGEIQTILLRHRGPGSTVLKQYAERITAPGYGWSSIRKGISNSSRVSRVFGFTTPGFHALTMDDRHGNCRIRIRSTGGSQILMDDTNERVYVSTGRGGNWMEMDWSGNIDFFAGRRFSVKASEDINFFSDKTVRIQGREGVHIVAGASDLPEHLQNLPDRLPTGQVRIHGQDDVHILSDTNIRTYSGLETLMEAFQSFHIRTSAELFTWSKDHTNIYAAKGSVRTTAGQHIHSTATEDISFFAGANGTFNAIANLGLHALTGKLDLASGSGTLVKAMGGSVEVQAVDSGIVFQTPHNTFAMDSKGFRGATHGQVLMQGENVEMRTTPSTPPNKALSNNEPPAGAGDCSGTERFEYTNQTSSKTLDGKTYTWPSGVDNMARACYNAGFRGKDLVRMVAIMGQESSFGRNVQGPAKTDSGQSTKNDPKYYPHCLGPFQMRCLRHPERYGGLDRQRTIENAFNLDASAKWAYKLQKTSKGGWNNWSGYTDGKYKRYLAQAEAAVAKLCGASSGKSVATAAQAAAGGGAAAGTQIAHDVVASSKVPLSAPALPDAHVDVGGLSPTVSAVKIGPDSVKVQGTEDVYIKTATDSVATSVQCLRSKMDDIVDTYNKSFSDTLNYIEQSTSHYKNMILTMATDLQAGLTLAANEVVPAGTIASLASIVDQTNDVVGLISEVQTSVGAFSGFPMSTLGGVEELFEIPNLDMEFGSIIPPQVSQLASDVEGTYAQLRNINIAVPGSPATASNISPTDMSDVMNTDTGNTPPTPPSSCP